MNAKINTPYPWAVIGAGPAGIANVGILIEQGVNPNDILWIDPDFSVGDFGKYWGEVYSNTSIHLFLRFLNEISSFNFSKKPYNFPIEEMPIEDCCQLKEVTKALSWVTSYLLSIVKNKKDYVNNLSVANNGSWQITTTNFSYNAKKIILATGATPKSLAFKEIKEISIYDALNPIKLKNKINKTDRIAVFGSSHSSMIIMKNLLDSGINEIINFYLTPHRYAIKMDNWTLYDNTGLKGHTAEWARSNISHKLDNRIKRYKSNDENIKKHLTTCDKAIYPIGFIPRSPNISGNICSKDYDVNTGIIAPGLFGTGIGYPLLKTDPTGRQEANVGLYKWMNDIRKVMPIWQKYDL